LSTSLMSHGPNHGTAELSSQVEGGSAMAGTCDATHEYDILVIHDSNNSVICDHDSLPQVSHLMSHLIVTCGMVNTISHSCLITLVI